jgi:hypothetical protein
MEIVSSGIFTKLLVPDLLMPLTNIQHEYSWVSRNWWYV